MRLGRISVFKCGRVLFPLCQELSLVHGATPALVERGILPSHIRADGKVETTPEFEDRVLAETGIAAGILDGLFAPTLTADERRQLLAEAYRAQARRRAFRLKPDHAP